MSITRIADLFCGAGGESTGIVQAGHEAGWKLDLAAVNHWPTAIETHRMNYPEARAYCHDLASLNPLDVFEAGQRVALLWGSPECTHHSIARGGRPMSEQSRASPWLILKWLTELRVDRVILENVPEFLSWGPLGVDGLPLKSGKGKLFETFIAALKALGYKVEWRILCAADFGDPTTRRRLFIQAVRVRGGAKIVWPSPTHAKNEPGLLPWRPAREIIDWSLQGESIFDRKRPLAPATMRRIEAGIRRYWGEWAEPFLVRFNGNHAGKMDGENRHHQLELPLGTLDTSNRYGLVRPYLVPLYGEREGQDPRTHDIDEPVPTIPASGSGKFGLVEPMVMSAGGPECAARPVSDPLGTILTRDHRAIIQPFILHQMSWGRSIPTDEPLPTVVSHGTHHVIEPFFVKYNGTADARPVRIPLDSVTTRDRFALVRGTAKLDITFRMLQNHELSAAMGFPEDYRFAGNKTEVTKQIGNAVDVATAKALTLSALGAA